MFRLLLTATYGAVLLLGLACAALAWWGANHAAFHYERTRAAEAVLISHLRVKNTADEVLREVALAAIASRDDAFDAASAQARFRQQFDDLRRSIAAEIALLPDDDDEQEELRRLAALEIQTYAATAQLEAVAALFAEGRRQDGSVMLQEVASSGFGPAFRAAVEAGIADERNEVAEAHADARAALHTVALFSKVAAGAALVVGIGALSLLLRQLTRPLAQLDQVARAVAAGDISPRVAAAAWPDEFGRVGRSFNEMLDEVARRGARLERGRQELEAAVAQRTTELAAANARLRRGDDARRRFLADVSHELRTPLTVIRGEAEIALRGAEKEGPVYRQALSRIAEEAAHTARLVDDLLFVARSEAGEARVASQAVAIEEVVRRAAAAARTLAEARGVGVAERLAAQGAVVQGDPDRLRQLVLILLDNAVRYSDPDAEVTVTLAPAPGGVQLSVSDQGMGIPPEELDRVFERFYRGEGAADRHAGGSGLGLPMARAIARAHGGEVTLESRLGEGTTARLVLPSVPRLRAAA